MNKNGGGGDNEGDNTGIHSPRVSCCHRLVCLCKLVKTKTTTMKKKDKRTANEELESETCHGGLGNKSHAHFLAVTHVLPLWPILLNKNKCFSFCYSSYL